MQKIRDDFIEKIRQKQPLNFETVSAEPEFIDIVDEALSNILLSRKYPHLKIPLAYVIRELISNAHKANLKRVYYRLNNLYINIPEDYAKGIKGFQETIDTDPYSIEGYLDDYKKFIKVVFDKYSGDEFVVYVINNSVITKEEAANINSKMNMYKQFSETGEQYWDEDHQGEGAGLGLFLTLQILKQISIKCSSLKVGVKEGKTFNRLSFNFSEVAPPPYNEFAKEILNQLDSLPKFPDNIRTLLKKLLNPEIAVMDVADEVQKDPSLSADVLKLVNSAQFALSRKIESIKEAVNYLGVKGLKGILYSYGAMSAMSERFGSIPEVWDHCYETAAFASKIAKFNNLKEKEDAVFTAGLLHDIGKIVLMSFDKEKAKGVEKICKQKGIEIPVVEEIMMGLSHAVIGGKVAEFWDFPEILINSIKYHHEPLMATDNKDVVYTIYLANHLSQNKNVEDYNFTSIETEIKNHFELKNAEDLKSFFTRIKAM